MTDHEEAAFVTALSRARHALRAPIGHIIGYAEMMAEDLSGDLDDEVVRDLRTIAGSGERLVAMLEEHLGAAKTSLDEIDLPEAQFQLRMQLNHISGYTEMLVETAEEESRPELIEDLGRIAAAERRLEELLDERLTPTAFEVAATGPVDTAAPSRAAPVTLELDALAEGGRVLVLDGDPTNRDLLERRLTRHGFVVVTAATGSEGLDALTSAEPDLVLMDVQIDGGTGLEILREMKSTPGIREIPVIVLSPVDDMDLMVESVLAGADDYLISPIRPILLLARIGASLEMARLRRRLARQLRIFISSPGDVIPERRALKQAIQQLDEQYGHDVQLVPVLWEEEPLVASETFQTQIIEPHDTDIYVAVVWSRIGSPLPETIVRPDGSRYESGTAYEFEDAMRSFREQGTPQMLLYRKTGYPTVALDDRDAVLERLDQLERLDRYIERWFRGEDGSYVGAFHQFDNAEELEAMSVVHLRKLVDRWLAAAHTPPE